MKNISSKLRHMLIVEDDKLTRMVEETIFKNFYNITVANDGQEALALLQEKHFDVILTDINMPMMDGITLTKKIRQLPNDNQGTLVIGITAYNEEEILQEGTNAGMNFVLTKPINKDEILSLI